MTSKQYIKHLTAAERSIRGKDVPQKSCARVIDGLCDLISDLTAVIAEKDTVIAAKDADIAKINQTIKLFQRQLFGRRSEKLHPDDPNQLCFDIGEEQVQLPASDEELKEAEQHVSDAVDGVRKDADDRRAREKERSARQRKGMTYRIPAGIPRKEPVRHYPDGYTPETMTVIGWNKHEYLEMEKPQMYDMQMELVLSSTYQHIDESTIPVNDQKHHTRKGYIWGDVDGMLEYGLVFFYDKGSRGEKVLYYIAVLYMLEANLKERKAGHDEIRAERQEKAVPILAVLRKLLEKYKTVDTPKSALTQACNYAIERWDGLCRYCEEGYYDIDKGGTAMLITS